MNVLGQITVMFALIKGSQYQCLQAKVISNFLL